MPNEIETKTPPEVKFDFEAFKSLKEGSAVSTVTGNPLAGQEPDGTKTPASIEAEKVAAAEKAELEAAAKATTQITKPLDDLDEEEARGAKALEKDSKKPAVAIREKEDGEEEDEEEVEPTLKPLKVEKKILEEDDDGEEEATPTTKGAVEDDKRTLKYDKTVFNEADVPFLKSMSRQAREYITAKIKKVNEQVAQLKSQANGELPSAYYEHPDAYLLDPHYKEAVSTANNVSAELNYWREQFAKVREGDPWQDLRRNAQGNIVPVDMKPGAEAETYLIGKLSEANEILARTKADVTSIQQNFSQNYKRKFGAITELESNIFPQFNDEKEVAKNKHIGLMNKVLESKGLQHIPSSLFTKLYAVSQEQSEYIKELEAKLEATKAQKKARLGPSSDELKGGSDGSAVVKRNGVATGESTFDFAAFEKIKNGG